ncbi:MAG: hypothetical protein RQ753_04350, partial [Desulfurivibrionaceae bacterium]|nr:hypothetical protein [Desulfurivibrionaceae bacterium]
EKGRKLLGRFITGSADPERISMVPPCLLFKARSASRFILCYRISFYAGDVPDKVRFKENKAELSSLSLQLGADAPLSGTRQAVTDSGNLEE